MHRAEIEGAFGTLHQRLRTLERKLNPSEQYMCFRAGLNVAPEDFEELLALAAEGLRTVRKHDPYFRKYRLYDDGMFWDDLFMLIWFASLHGQKGMAVPESVLRSLVEVLVDISHYSLVGGGGDIVKGNENALANLLYRFPLPSLQLLARARAKQSPEVTEFVDWTLDAVAKARY